MGLLYPNSLSLPSVIGSSVNLIPFRYDVLVENLMDPAHVPYAHYGLMRVGKPKGNFDKICIFKTVLSYTPSVSKICKF